MNSFTPALIPPAHEAFPDRSQADASQTMIAFP